MINKDCCIVVISYKIQPDRTEIDNLKRLFSLYKNRYDIILVYPNNKKTNFYDENFEFDNILLIDNNYFENFPYGYNILLTSNFFYKLFSSYKYILIHHPDAYIIKDELEYWINKDYDIIGAPFIYDIFPNNINTFDFLKNTVNYSNDMNGGLCLRKVKFYLNITEKYEKQMHEIFKQSKLNEDQILNIIGLLGEDISKYNLPKFTEAIKFAWSAKPYLLMQINNFELPFGLHAHTTLYKYFYDKIKLF